MKKKRTILVDDEPLALQALKLTFNEIAEVEVVAECANGYEAVKAVQELNPDLLFLDIQMPGLNGFDVLELLAEKAPPTIFVTAYDEYAIKAFEAQAIDYLLKPVQRNRLEQAIKHARDFLPESAEKVIDAYREIQVPLQRILIRIGTGVQVIPVEQITHFEAQDDFVEVYTEKESHLKYERLGRLEQVLDSHTFIRVHRSFILNVSYLKKIEPYSQNSRLGYLKNGKVVQISKNGYKKLLEVL